MEQINTSVSSNLTTARSSLMAASSAIGASVEDASIVWMDTTDEAVQDCCYQNAATCPDCGGGMVRLGNCFSCPICGWGCCG